MKKYGTSTGEPVGRWSGREDNSDPSDFSDDSDKGGKEAGRNFRRTGRTVRESAGDCTGGPPERWRKCGRNHPRTAWNSKVFPDNAHYSLQCALLATAQPGGAGSESSELSELSEKFALKNAGGLASPHLISCYYTKVSTTFPIFLASRRT